MSENELQNQENETESENGTYNWLQDNLRIIVSIIIVIAIAGGIYSYSKRSQAPTLSQDEKSANKEENIFEFDESNQQENDTDTDSSESNKQENKETPSEDKQVASTSTSKETDGSFVESAQKGEGATHLARRALANYLEKNPDSSLTPEHKIYIEDYLRKNAARKGGIKIGTTMEFSKDLIKKAIESSKNLNEKQLKNLHKYAVKVPQLS